MIGLDGRGGQGVVYAYQQNKNRKGHRAPRPTPKGMITMTATPKMISAPELAETLGTTGKDCRAFLRSITPRDAQPGKGSRWALPGNAKAIAAFRKGYQEWEAKRDADRAARAAEKAATTAQIADATDEDLDALAETIMSDEAAEAPEDDAPEGTDED